jgi:hypothetical protein
MRILLRARPPGIGSSFGPARPPLSKKREIRRIKDRATRIIPVTKGKKPGPGIPDLRIP